MLVHGDNLLQKENHTTKYQDQLSKTYLAEIREKYNQWKSDNEALKGPFIAISDNDGNILNERVRLFNEYKNFIDEQKYAEKFDSRSNLHSSVLEEFIYYLFRDLVTEFSQTALLGKAHAFKDIFFQAPNFKEMVQNPCVKIEIKDHDFVIGVNVETTLKCSGSPSEQKEILQIPAVAIECKTYLDKTMLEGSSTAAAQLLTMNPNAIYIVVAEWLKLTDKVNLKKYKVDQIYVLRKQKNTDREFRYLPDYVKNPIYEDVVTHLYNTVRNHLLTDWQGGVENGIEHGILI
ncbi:Bpu10I family restriction endonuclease [Parabacteroides provencensis]|uniref:Bpu10I family restriction endonuclease n=1 Tax=Parabacteroides provencensis TaxID=1944636 RepID=UPI000C14ED7F|nr:Bpu10I family restriction endonuclease [Parabacteroides provencensis]